jgi:crotonobetainyl-CoA hydratase
MWSMNDRELAAILASEDAKEGPTAFAENRPPRWTGSLYPSTTSSQ